MIKFCPELGAWGGGDGQSAMFRTRDPASLELIRLQAWSGAGGGRRKPLGFWLKPRVGGGAIRWDRRSSLGNGARRVSRNERWLDWGCT